MFFEANFIFINRQSDIDNHNDNMYHQRDQITQREKKKKKIRKTQNHCCVGGRRAMPNIGKVKLMKKKENKKNNKI